MSTKAPPLKAIKKWSEADAAEPEPEPASVSHDDPEPLVFLANIVCNNAPILTSWSDNFDLSRGVDPDAMANALLYREVCASVNSYFDLELHLTRYSDVADSLGFGDIPHHTTFATAHRERFSDLIVQQIEEVAESFREETHVERCCAKYAIEEPDSDWPVHDLPGLPEIERFEKDRAFDKVKPILHDVVDFERAPNAEIPAESLVEFAGYLARRNTFAEQGSERFWIEEADDVEDHFSPETFRRAVRNKERQKTRVPDEGTMWVEPRDWSINKTEKPGGTDDWHSTLEEGVERLVGELNDAGVIDGPVPICIDASIRPYHKHPDGADERPEGVYQESHFETNYGYKDISASAIINGRSVVLANVSHVPGDRFFKSVKYLIDRVTDLVDVECFYADAEFATTRICRYIEHTNDEYVFKKPHTGPVVDALDEMDGKAGWTDYTMRTATRGAGGITEVNSTLFAVEKRGQIGVKKGVKRDEETSQTAIADFQGVTGATGQQEMDAFVTDEDVELVAFITNKEITSVGVDPEENPIGHDPENTVWGAAQGYRRRWSIETAFRQIKYQFMARTTSRDLGVRRFFWMIAMLLYNSWAVMCLLVQENVSHVPDDRPPVRAKVFLEQLAKKPPPD